MLLGAMRKFSVYLSIFIQLFPASWCKLTLAVRGRCDQIHCTPQWPVAQPRCSCFCAHVSVGYQKQGSLKPLQIQLAGAGLLVTWIMAFYKKEKKSNF